MYFAFIWVICIKKHELISYGIIKLKKSNIKNKVKPYFYYTK